MEKRIVKVGNKDVIISSEKFNEGDLVYDYAHGRITIFDSLEVNGGNCSDHCWKVINFDDDLEYKVECHDCNGSGLENSMLVSLGADESICNRCSGTGLEDNSINYSEFK
jgi:hypothetical protein